MDRVRWGVFLALLGSLVLPAKGMTLMSVEQVCPIGGETFEAVLAGSGTQFGLYLDRKPFGPTPAPWPLAKCPSNGFVLFKEEFADQELAVLQPYVESGEYQAAQSQETDYYLAALLLRRIGADPLQVAEALLQSTWETSDPERYARYAVEALSEYENVLATEMPGDESMWIEQLAGELERRLGRFEAAQERFERLLERPEVAGTRLQPVLEQELRLVAAGDSGQHRVHSAP